VTVGRSVATATATTLELPVVDLGASGLRVSRIGIGLAALGRPAYMALGRDVDLGPDRTVQAMERECHAVLDAAYEAGVTYVDTARSYGCAELFLSRWWSERRLPDDALTVGSKWGYTYTGNWRIDAPSHEFKDLSVATLRRQAAESWRILGSRLSLYQIHTATLESGVLDDTAVLTHLLRLRDCGVRIGLTASGPRQADVVRRALEVRVDGIALFQTVQATWNLLETSAGPALAEAHAAGVGVIIKESLANGRLTDRGGGAALRTLRTSAAELGTSVEAFAIASVLAQPWADVVLSGAVTSRQLDACVAATHIASRVEVPAAVAEPPAIYWRRRETVPWR
jgi:aryl-alcohol dehydrogenase-like predicted oxidoreductase